MNKGIFPEYNYDCINYVIITFPLIGILLFDIISVVSFNQNTTLLLLLGVKLLDGLKDDIVGYFAFDVIKGWHIFPKNLFCVLFDPIISISAPIVKDS